MSRRDTHNEYHGALLVLAAGDALGTTLEFKAPGFFDPITRSRSLGFLPWRIPGRPAFFPLPESGVEDHQNQEQLIIMALESLLFTEKRD
jgi:hypothetical protein